MNLGPRLLRHTAMLVLLPAIALAGCQAPTTSVNTALTANPNAERGTVQILLGGVQQAQERSVLGLGFADTEIVAARVTVMGADMVKESKTVAWNGTDALNVSLNVPAGNCRLFILEALDADPATATTEPAVRAVIRGAANVGAAASVTVNLNYNSDAIGRVLETLNETLAYGSPIGTTMSPLGPVPVATTSPVPDARKLELTTALTSATFLGQLETFVNKVTRYTGPTAMQPNGSYAGVNPVYFNADYLVNLLIANGPTTVQAEPPLPLESFRAVGNLNLNLNNATSAILDPKKVTVTLQVPFSEYKEGGAFHLDKGTVTGGGGPWGTYAYKDVPPGNWGVVAKMDGQVIGSGRVRIRHGENTGVITVHPPEVANLTGLVTDEEGAPVTGAQVTVTSLNPVNPYETTVETADGVYLANNVPAGVQVRVRATKDGHTLRERVTVLELYPSGATLNRVSFGEDLNEPTGRAHFISDFPEIETAVASPETLLGERLSYKVTLSEPLDDFNRRLFEEFFVITSDGAVPGAGTVELDEQSTFLGEDNRVSMSWDAAGKVMTVSFDAPLFRYDDDALTYRFRLRRSAVGAPIEDAAGNMLGMMPPSPGGYYTDAFRISNPVLSPTDNTDALRWAAVHAGSASFDVAADEVEPVLNGVTVTTPTVPVFGQVTRISLTFSEPMGVYAGVGNVVLGSSLGVPLTDGAALTSPQHFAFTFAVGETAADLDDVTLDGDSPVIAAATWGDLLTERETEFALNAPRLSVNPDDVKTLRLEVNGVLFDDAVNAIKARVEGLSDPAGNAITESSADANVQVGNI